MSSQTWEIFIKTGVKTKIMTETHTKIYIYKSKTECITGPDGRYQNWTDNGDKEC